MKALALTAYNRLRTSFVLDYQRLAPLLAITLGAAIWTMPPPSSLDQRAMVFIASLVTAVILWTFEVCEDYIVALMLLLSWVIFNVTPPDVALSGFSSPSWFFVVAALGMGAAVGKSRLLNRMATAILSRIRPRHYKRLPLLLSAFGLFATPALPTGPARVAIMTPVIQAISKVTGLKPRSNGSANLTLGSYLGFGQMSFMFLTGGAHCLVGWSLLPGAAKSEFGWLTWSLAALPAAIFTWLFLLGATYLFFPPRNEDWAIISRNGSDVEALTQDGCLSRDERISLGVLSLTLVGWITKPLHGIAEVWIAVGGLVVFMATRVLDKKSLRSNVDWGFLLFFGIAYSLAPVSSHLGIDTWLLNTTKPILLSLAFHPGLFLSGVVLLVYIVHFFLKKVPTVVLLTIALTPLAEDLGIHPGILVVTIVMSVEGFFLSYQDGPYQILYYTTDGQAFSQRQGRKLLAAKFLACFLAVAISLPYWHALGFIESSGSSVSTVISDDAVPARTAKSEAALVSRTQKLLLQVGYNPGPVDGIVGPRTRGAIREYQNAQGLRVDGTVSRELLTRLRETAQ